MTRYARAEGSKASNKRAPEEATDWKTMKADLLKKQKEIEAEKMRKKFEEQRLENYNAFLKEKKKPVNTTWSEFTSEKSKKRPGETENKTPKKKKKLMAPSEENLDAEIDAFCDEVKDSKMDEQFEKLKNGVLKSLKKSKSEEKIFEENNEEKFDDWIVEEVDKEKLGKKKAKRAAKLKKSESNEVTTNKISKKEKLNKKKIKNENQKKQVNPSEEPENKIEEENKLNNSIVEADLKKSKPKKKKLKNKIVVNLGDENQKEEIKNLNLSTESNKSDPNKKKIKKDNQKKQLNQNEKQKRNNKNKNEFNYTTKNKVPITHIMIDNRRIELEKFDGFPIKKEDATRLKELKSEMIKKGIPMQEVNRTMKLERRKAEKALTRERKKVCFICRKAGHVLSECPDLDSNKEAVIPTSGTGICFKCGSTEHTHFECRVVRGDNYKFANCFICKESGHISRQCPDNPKGLYPKGGACRVCGDVTHLKKDCPQFQVQQEKNTITVRSFTTSQTLESIDDDQPIKQPVQNNIRKNKIIKF